MKKRSKLPQKKSVKSPSSKLSVTAPPTRKSSYDKDFYKWTIDQAKLLKDSDFSKLDVMNLIEEIESLGKTEKRTLESHLRNLLLHLLKIKYQPAYHTRSWDNSVKLARIEALECLKENPSLKPIAEEIFQKAYRLARISAATETCLIEKTFPEKCPWSFEECMKEKR